MSGLRIRETRPQEWPAAFSLSLAQEPTSSATADRQAAHFREYLDVQNLTVTWNYVIASGARIVGACLGIESPGRTAMVLLSGCQPHTPLAEALVDALGAIERGGRQRNLAMLQAVIPEPSSGREHVLRSADFRYLADLRYLSRHVEPLRPVRCPFDLQTYAPDCHAEFAAVLERTYQDSLDCPGLNGMRDIQDILTSHRHTGIHQPDLWLLAKIDGRAVGVVLMSVVPLRPAVELVYVGVTPDARGNGLGRHLVEVAIDRTRACGRDHVLLAVDQRNHYALEIYHALGFVETDRRHAWIRALHPNP